MLIRITQRCRMECRHCLVEATKDGEHMETETFVNTLLFCLELGDPVILITGGEPTEHPNLIGFLEGARGQAGLLTVLSNGMFLHEWSDRGIQRLLDLVNGVQVTNDSRYYPIRVEPYEHPKVTFEPYLRTLSPHGRAKANGLDCNRRAPECFNLRSLSRAGLLLPQAMGKLYSMQRFCTPSINIDGSIVAGESTSCMKVGDVTESIHKISQRLANMTCDRCGLATNLDPMQKHAIGESRIIAP